MDDEVKRQELKLRNAVKDDKQFRVKKDASVEVAQVRFNANILLVT